MPRYTWDFDPTRCIVSGCDAEATICRSPGGHDLPYCVEHAALIGAQGLDHPNLVASA